MRDVSSVLIHASCNLDAVAIHDSRGVSGTVLVILSTDAHVIRLVPERLASRTWKIAVEGNYQGGTIGIDLSVFLLAAQP